MFLFSNEFSFCCVIHSFLAEFSTFFVKIILSLLVTGEELWWGLHKFFVRAQRRLFLWTSWICARRELILLSFLSFQLACYQCTATCLWHKHWLQAFTWWGDFRMHRQADHVMAFLLAELGTSGSLDGQQRLVIKGRFAPKNFEGILRRYISKFLTLSQLVSSMLSCPEGRRLIGQVLLA